MMTGGILLPLLSFVIALASLPAFCLEDGTGAETGSGIIDYEVPKEQHINIQMPAEPTSASTPAVYAAPPEQMLQKSQEMIQFSQAATESAQSLEAELGVKRANAYANRIAIEKGKNGLVGIELENFLSQPTPDFPKLTRREFLRNFNGIISEIDRQESAAKASAAKYSARTRQENETARILLEQIKRQAASAQDMNSLSDISIAKESKTNTAIQNETPTDSSQPSISLRTGNASRSESSKSLMVGLDSREENIDLAQVIGTQSKLVPDSFLDALEIKLKKIESDKETILALQELGKELGIEELAKVNSTEDLSSLWNVANSTIKNTSSSPQTNETVNRDKAKAVLSMSEENAVAIVKILARARSISTNASLENLSEEKISGNTLPARTPANTPQKHSNSGNEPEKWIGVFLAGALAAGLGIGLAFFIARRRRKTN
jgi:hypothetical protein